MADQDALQALEQKRSVGQPRQRVVQGLAAQLVLGGARLRDVGDHRQRADRLTVLPREGAGGDVEDARRSIRVGVADLELL